MNLSELKQQVWDIIDDAPVDLAVMRWFDQAQRRMASAVGAIFPKLVANNAFDMAAEPTIPEKWQNALVVYACARYKESEASTNEASSFQQQFEDLMKEFSENYEVPVIYRDDRTSQQFTATAGQTQFVITKVGFDTTYGNLQVFVNGTPTTYFMIDFNTNPAIKSFTLTPIQPSLAAGDKVTALWEEHYDITNSPNPFWNW